MHYTLIIFLGSFLIRILYIIMQGGNLEDKLIEDELLYWTWSLKGAYTLDGEISKNVLTERMPGAFYYYQFLISLTANKINYILYIQALLDSTTCFVMAKCVSKFYPEEFLKVYIFAAVSPLMIIMCSQTLAETLFLFFFTFFIFFTVCTFYSKKIILNLFLAGSFLGLTTFVKTITYPLIILLFFPIAIILVIKNHNKLKITLSMFLFLTAAFLPISERLINNIKIHETLSLTSQLGTHLAYWVTPAVICYTKDVNRHRAVEIINDEVKNQGSFKNDAYKDSKLLTKTAFSILKDISYLDLTYLWVRASLLNIISPPILLDKNVRKLPHPSFYSVSEPLKWIKKLFFTKDYHYYLLIVLTASISSVFILLSLLLGPIELFKKDKFIFFVSIFYILFFCIITGPVLSPKYIIGILPCLFLYQAITLSKLISLKKFFQ